VGSEPPAGWPPRIEASQPAWSDYRGLLERVQGPGFPSPAALNALLPGGLVSGGGQAVRFVSSACLDDGPYEQRIHDTGQVSTRPGSWHDLFNALVWVRLPAIKRAMNALHCRPQPDAAPGRRGRARDALTLFDECGIVIASPDRSFLEAIARHDWQRVFRAEGDLWGRQATVVVAGHALLEKLLAPYKAVTANALLVQFETPFQQTARNRRVRAIDTWLAARMLGGGLLRATGELTPLPVMGIPGWWPAGKQDTEFYSDSGVFRPPRPGRTPATVLEMAGSL
jgi:hypothetical protein